MSATFVSVCHLICDSCGAISEVARKDATSTRIQASVDGWKYTSYSLRGKGLQKYSRQPGEPSRVAPKQWDCCPACPLPSLAEAMALKDKREAATP